MAPGRKTREKRDELVWASLFLGSSAMLSNQDEMAASWSSENKSAQWKRKGEGGVSQKELVTKDPPAQLTKAVVDDTKVEQRRSVPVDRQSLKVLLSSLVEGALLERSCACL